MSRIVEKYGIFRIANFIFNFCPPKRHFARNILNYGIRMGKRCDFCYEVCRNTIKYILKYIENSIDAKEIKI